MTKKDIIKLLETYGVKATTRARKSTLEALLKEKSEGAKEVRDTVKKNKIDIWLSTSILIVVVLTLLISVPW